MDSKKWGLFLDIAASAVWGASSTAIAVSVPL